MMSAGFLIAGTAIVLIGTVLALLIEWLVVIVFGKKYWRVS